MKLYLLKNPDVIKEKSKQLSIATKKTVSSFNIITKETKRIPTELFNEKDFWVGITWNGFYEIILPDGSTEILIKKNNIIDFANKIGVKYDWITRRKNRHIPFKHTVKRHKHLDGTIIIFHNPEDIDNYFNLFDASTAF